MFKNTIILITGRTGSFGNAVLNKFLPTEAKGIPVFSRDENNIMKLENTRRLSIDELMEKLLILDFIQKELRIDH